MSTLNAHIDEKTDESRQQRDNPLDVINKSDLENSLEDALVSNQESLKNPVLKIVKLVADFKDTATENIEKLLNNKKDLGEEVETTTRLEPNDSDKDSINEGEFIINIRTTNKFDNASVSHAFYKRNTKI